MGSNSWVISNTRLVIGLVVVVLFSLSGLVIKEILGIDLGIFKYLGVPVGVIAFSFIALRKPEVSQESGDESRRAKNESWVASTPRLIIGIIVAVLLSLSGLVIEEILGIDLGIFKNLGVPVGIIAFSFIALRKPKEA